MTIFYPVNRREWRTWLLQHHATEKEVWLKTYPKASGKSSVSYDDMVEECLCFGWIDGVVKKVEPDSMLQRITPRRKKTFLSELNRQRIWKLQQSGLMTPAGIEPVKDQIGSPDDPLMIPEWIEMRLREDPRVWENFLSFSPFYQRLKVGWIAEIRGASRMPEAEKRLNYLIKMTRDGKTYGTQPMLGL